MRVLVLPAFIGASTGHDDNETGAKVPHAANVVEPTSLVPPDPKFDLRR